MTLGKMVTVLPVPCDLLKDAAQAQVVAWDERFHVAAESDAVVNAKAQSSAFGGRDATGVEAVKDVMPTEMSIFDRLICKVSDKTVQVLDFGCGDGRYLRQFLRSAEVLAQSGRALRIVAYEVSAEALRSFHIQAQREGMSATESKCGEDDHCHLPSLEGRNLQLEFVLGSCSMTAVQVSELLRRWGPAFDVAVIGWGTISSIPRLPGLSAEELLQELSKLARFVMNVVSSTNNHVKFQRRYQAMRRAWSETHRPEVKSWLEQKIGLATFDRSYYYTVDTKQKMFYAAISAELEAARLRDAGFENVRVQICNIINFFDIQTKPKAARINAAVIRLLERGDVWRAQLLLSRGVALAFNKPLSSLRIGSCIFDNSSEHALYGQVARYFISTGESAR